MSDVNIERYTDLVLPRWRCAPVHVALPDRLTLSGITDRLPAKLEADEAAASVAFRYGIDLFNSGYFWEAHEIWEPVWMRLAPNSRERLAAQAFIQAANAFLKLATSRENAFQRVAGEAVRLGREACARGSVVLGVDVEAWLGALETFAARSLGAEVAASGFEPGGLSGFPYLRFA